MYHPVQKVVESLYAAGRCPRLHVNAMNEGVVCPDEIRARWRERLILDLDATYPLDLQYDEVGLSADLSFGGVVSRCVFPWPAIYVVADRASGRGIVLDEHLPESVRRASQMPTTGPLPERSDLRRVFDSRPSPVAAVEASVEGAGEEDAPTTGPHPDADTKPEAKAKAKAKDEDAPQARPTEESESKAQARRAAFKIIDGGG